MKPRALDLFCGAGGVSKGLHLAGFEVVGVDIQTQPNYPFEFHQANALTFPLDGFDFYAASPPCQRWCYYGRRPNHVAERPALIDPIRDRLLATGKRFAIENVVGARAELRDPILLCGSMFGLDVQRHRLIESNFHVPRPRCDHSIWTPRFASATNRLNLRKTVEVGVWRIPLDVQRRAMGIDWMTLQELSQAIPPAYGAHVGRAALATISR